MLIQPFVTHSEASGTDPGARAPRAATPRAAAAARAAVRTKIYKLNKTDSCLHGSAADTHFDDSPEQSGRARGASAPRRCSSRLLLSFRVPASAADAARARLAPAGNTVRHPPTPPPLARPRAAHSCWPSTQGACPHMQPSVPSFPSVGRRVARRGAAACGE